MEEASKAFELSSEQQDTAALLKELLGQTMADRYVDVCRLSAGAFQLRISAPVAAHAMREFESALRGILEVPMDAKVQQTAEEEEQIAAATKLLKDMGFDVDGVQEAAKKLRSPKHNDQIRKIVARLDLDPKGDIAKAWIAIRASVKKAHNRSFNQALKVDNEFRAKLLEPFEAVVRGVAIALQKKYASLVTRVNQIIAMDDRALATRTFAEEIPWALSLHWHYFQKIDTGDWLPHLIDKGLLDSPPPIAPDESDKGARMGEWPAGHYLLKMARAPDAETHRLVIEALKAVSASDHPDIRRQGMEILTALPAADSAPHAELAVKWFLRDGNSIVVDRGRQLVISLAKGKQSEAALKTARALLQVWDNDGNVANLFGHHMYEHHLPEIGNALVECCGQGALTFFLDLFEETSAIGGFGDYMHYSTRPFIERNTPADGVYGALASIVTSVAKRLIEEKQITVPAVVAGIAARSPKMFKRIAMHILASHASEAPEIVDAYLTDPEYIGEDWCKEEYAELANARFPALKPEQQSAILKIIDAIPDEFRENWKARFEAHNKRPVTEADVKIYDDHCFRDLVWGWKNVLPKEHQDRLKAIEAEHGDPDAWKANFHPTEISRLEAGDFASRSVADVAAYLKSWRPDESNQRQTLTALAQALRMAVSMNDKKYAVEADQFIGAPPIYLRRLFEGLQNAVGNGGEYPWEKVLNLIDYTFEQYRKPVDPAMAAEGGDKDWTWACMAAAELLATGLRKGAGSIGFENAAKVQELSLKLSSISPQNPIDDDFEDKYKRDAFFACQHTLRGQSLELCILTMFWLSKDKSTPLGTDGRKAIELLPELRTVFEKELTDTTSTGRIPRAIIGKYLTWMFYFGEDWLKAEMSRLMPTDNEALSDATWVSHLCHDSRPVPGLLPQLRPSYTKEIAGLAVNKYNDRQSAIENRIGEYILNQYIGGFMPDDLMDAFWRMAPSRLLQHNMWALGRYLKEQPNELNEEERGRGYTYWDKRLAAAQASSDPESFRGEIGAFGQWCIGKKDAPWYLGQMRKMLNCGFAPTHSYGIMEWLAEVASDNLDEAVETLLALISNKHTDRWAYLMHDAPIRFILTQGLERGTDATKKSVEKIVSILSSKGETKYTEILNKAA